MQTYDNLCVYNSITITRTTALDYCRFTSVIRLRMSTVIYKVMLQIISYLIIKLLGGSNLIFLQYRIIVYSVRECYSDRASVLRLRVLLICKKCSIQCIQSIFSTHWNDLVNEKLHFFCFNRNLKDCLLYILGRFIPH